MSIPDYPFPRTCPFDPAAEYTEARSGPPEQVQVPGGGRAWLITRHEDVRGLLVDPRVSADRRHPNLPLTQEVTPQTRAGIAAVGRCLIGLDPPEHGPRRRALAGEFSAHRIRALRPFIRRVVDERIDALLAGPRPADLMAGFCVPVPSLILCELLGVPWADREFFQERAAAQVRRGLDPALRQRAGGELRGYLDDLVAAKEADPTDDLLGRLVERDRRKVPGDRAFDHPLLVGLAMLLMVAGHDSTTSMLALSVARLLQDPGQAERLTDPVTAGPAIEELLRYLAVVDSMPRVAAADIEIDGVTLREGDGLLFAFASANRDDKAFPDPDVLDLQRGARNHVAFGFGVHQCLGQNLARAELEIGLRALFTRIPGLRTAVPLTEIPFATDSDVHGVEHLPVTW